MNVSSSRKACTLISLAATATLPLPSTWETENGKLQVSPDIPVKLKPATWEQKNLRASKVKREETGSLFYDETLRTGGQLARKVKRFDLTYRAWVENCTQLVKYLSLWTEQSWNCDTYSLVLEKDTFEVVNLEEKFIYQQTQHSITNHLPHGLRIQWSWKHVLCEGEHMFPFAIFCRWGSSLGLDLCQK